MKIYYVTWRLRGCAYETRYAISSEIAETIATKLRVAAVTLKTGFEQDPRIYELLVEE